MPGSVQNALPTTVLPNSLCTAFSQARHFALMENFYKNGESQRSLLVVTSRKQWRLGKGLLVQADLTSLRDFFDARRGWLEPFYFYDVFETSPKFSYDPTGIALAGRYTVRFTSHWEQVVGVGLVESIISLVELA